MRYYCTVSGYDMFDEVTVSAVVKCDRRDVGEQEPVELLRASTTVQGVGESDPREWLKDALIALLEEL